MAYFTIITTSLQVITVAAASFRDAITGAEAQGYKVSECREAR